VEVKMRRGASLWVSALAASLVTATVI
jgi:hypothetical protein